MSFPDLERTVTIDFESRGAPPLRGPEAVGAWNYWKHAETIAICLAWKTRAMLEPAIWWPDHFDAEILRVDPLLYLQKTSLEHLYAFIEEGYAVEAHNKFFEECGWLYHMIPKHGAPPIDPDQWSCTMARANAAGWPGALEDLAKAMKLAEEKDSAGHRVMLQCAKPRKPTKSSPSRWFEDGERLSQVFRYCIQDVVVEEEASARLPKLDPDQLATWRLDQKINRRGIFCDVPMCEAAEAVFDELSDSLNFELKEITDGAVTSAGQVAKLVDWLRSMGCMVGDVKKATVDWCLDDPKCPFTLTGSVRRVLEIRRSLSRSSVKKYQAMRVRADADDFRIRDTLRFSSARTGRWAGAGIQPQNYPADRGNWLGKKDYNTLCDAVTVGSLQWLRMLYDTPATALALATRGALRASPEHDLLVADFSSIEARGLLWAARDPEIVHVDKAYERMGARIYGLEVEEVTKTKNPRARFVGKEAVLGCGYGMGWRKFQATVEAKGVFLSDEDCQLAVNTYREVCSAVPEFWRATERAAIAAVRNPHRSFRINGLFTWFMSTEGGVPYLNCRLPSGRLMRYIRPAIGKRTPPWPDAKPQDALTYWGMSTAGGPRKWKRLDTYGGKLVENVIQALCACIMMAALRRLEAAGYPIVSTVHDEAIAEVPEGFGSVEEFERIMAEVPPWAAGMPIKAEGGRMKRYQK